MKPDRKKDKKAGKKNGKQANKPTAKELIDGELDKVQGGLIRFPIKN